MNRTPAKTITSAAVSAASMLRARESPVCSDILNLAGLVVMGQQNGVVVIKELSNPLLFFQDVHVNLPRLSPRV